MILEILYNHPGCGDRQIVVYDGVYESFTVANDRWHHPRHVLETVGLYSYRGCTGIYTERPDGTWYKLEDFWMVRFHSNHKQLYDLIQSGLEPWRAFEIIAL